MILGNLTQKVCSKCGENKSIDQYYWMNKEKNTIHPKCKDCSFTDSQLPGGRFSTCKATAKKRKYNWALTFDEFMTFWKVPCFYCGSEINTIGLDRVDNTKGYESDNVVPCCALCNYMKNALKQEVFLEQVIKISDFRSKS